MVFILTVLLDLPHIDVLSAKLVSDLIGEEGRRIRGSDQCSILNAQFSSEETLTMALLSSDEN
jgi:hypothetical protein